jgi:hypothetical protein
MSSTESRKRRKRSDDDDANREPKEWSASNWRQYYGKYRTCIASICGERESKRQKRSASSGTRTLSALDARYYEELPAHVAHENLLKKLWLLDCVDWKHSRGKFRPNKSKIESKNSDKSVLDAAQEAFKCIDALAKMSSSPSRCSSESSKSSKNAHDSDDSNDANDLCAMADSVSRIADALAKALYGVGPMTAAVVLVLRRPDLVAFPSDEAQNALFGASKYTLPRLREFLSELYACQRRLGLYDMSVAQMERALFAYAHRRQQQSIGEA